MFYSNENPIMRSRIFITCLVFFTAFSIQAEHSHEGEAELVKAFLELENVPEPLGGVLKTLRKKKTPDDLQRFTMELHETLMPVFHPRRNDEGEEEKIPDDPATMIPYLIALIDADNSDVVYGVSRSLQNLTEVRFSPFHDGAFWRRWWEKNKSNFSETVQKIAIPELPKTKHGKSYTPFSEELETLQGRLDYLRKKFEPVGGKPVEFRDGEFYSLADAIAEFKDPRAIPHLIAAVEADNTYATVYGIGCFGLGERGGLTDVKYSPFHDGAWWRRWWEKNKSNYSENIRNIPIPDFPKTAYGKTHKPFPIETETVQGQLRFFQQRARLIKEKYQDNYEPIIDRPNLSFVAVSIAEFDDPVTIPYLIAIVALDDDRPEIYGNASTSFGYMAGYFGLHRITGVKSDKSHNGPWWRKWWDENRSNYPPSVAKIDVPNINAEWDIPDVSKEVAEWRQQKTVSERKEREEKMLREVDASDSDVADVSGVKTTVAGQPRMEYFLIGYDETKTTSDDGYKLLVIMPGGDGSAEFHPFVRRIFKYATLPLEENFIAVQPIAVKWTPKQQIVWPTENVKVDKQEFSTEAFIESMIGDVSKRTKIDPKHVYTLTWSSSGPAAYAIALREKTAVTGSYITMSVFKPNELPPLDRAKDRVFVIEHSPEDRVCPFRMAKDAEEKLTKHGAALKFVEYEGGHGWRGNLYGRLRENLRWMVEKNR